MDIQVKNFRSVWSAIRTVLMSPELMLTKLLGLMVVASGYIAFAFGVVYGDFLEPLLMFLFFLSLFAVALYRGVKLVRDPDRWAAFQDDWLRWGP